MSLNRLEWNDEYSVEVVELDDQHKKMFAIINELLEAIASGHTEEHLEGIIDFLIKFKMFHFETEEKYFKEFNYDGAEEHIAIHKQFNNKIDALRVKYPKYTNEFAFELVDFLEDWLIGHLLTTDHKYIKCFHDHGLK